MRIGSSLEQKSAWLKEKNAALAERTGDYLDERRYSVAEVAVFLNLSQDKVRRMFQDEPGVLVIGDQSSRHKRRYTTLRIPESVLRRVLRRMSNV